MNEFVIIMIYYISYWLSAYTYTQTHLHVVPRSHTCIWPVMHTPIKHPLHTQTLPLVISVWMCPRVSGDYTAHIFHFPPYSYRLQIYNYLLCSVFVTCTLRGKKTTLVVYQSHFVPLAVSFIFSLVAACSLFRSLSLPHSISGTNCCHGNGGFPFDVSGARAARSGGDVTPRPALYDINMICVLLAASFAYQFMEILLCAPRIVRCALTLDHSPSLSFLHTHTHRSTHSWRSLLGVQTLPASSILCERGHVPNIIRNMDAVYTCNAFLCVYTSVHIEYTCQCVYVCVFY